MLTDKQITRAYASMLPDRGLPKYDWRAIYATPAETAPQGRFGDDPAVLAAYPSANEIARRHAEARAAWVAGQTATAELVTASELLAAQLELVVPEPQLAGV